jgi:hypothetical protein
MIAPVNKKFAIVNDWKEMWMRAVAMYLEDHLRTKARFSQPYCQWQVPSCNTDCFFYWFDDSILEDVASVYALQGLNTAMNPLSTGGVV